MSNIRWLDFLIMLTYLVAMVSVGVRFSRKQTTTEAYFVAKRSIPSWAMGFSIVATLITAITFIAYPGSAYGKDWSLLIPGFMVVGVLALAGAIIIPFYRNVVGMSAYEYFGKRFGTPTRMYASFAFSMAHFSKMGFILYLLALTINSMTGWSMNAIIAVVGVATVFYTVVGGLEAVIWTDVIQGFVLWVGVVICLGYLFFLPPGGPPAVLRLAWQNHKFSLGNFDLNLTQPTGIVLILYGFFWYLQKYTADQTVVQRYLVAKTDRDAIRGVALGAGLCVPVWALFMLIGTCTWSFYKLTGEPLPKYITKTDQVFPYFLTVHLPVGMAGLFMASLMGATMSGLASDLNCLAVVGVEDFYRLFHPAATDRQRLRLGKMIVGCCGLLCIGIALVLAHSKGSALSMWFSISAIASGGLAGLFVLAFFSARATRGGVYVGIVASVLFTLWATLTMGDKRALDLGRYNYGWNDLIIGAVAHVILFAVGYMASLLLPAEKLAARDMTIWKWLAARKSFAEPARAVRGA
jgi:SSS family solute:Na+ symporter